MNGLGHLSAVVCATALLCACAGPAKGRPFAAELEAAAVWQSRNDAAVPGDSGTRVQLDEVIGSGPFAAGRTYLTWRPAERHELRGLAAPLQISGRGELDGPVSFAGQGFAAGPVRATYRFDSYRLTWRYHVYRGEAWDWFAGLTGKVRSAEIELEQGGVRGRKTDVGFVPLLHAAADWRFAEDWRLALDVDGAWAPQGRALDASLKTWWALRDNLEVGLGYRTIEGGADNDEVYTFAWIHQAVLSMRVTF